MDAGLTLVPVISIQITAKIEDPSAKRARQN
jgi:hypothetical protein